MPSTAPAVPATPLAARPSVSALGPALWLLTTGRGHRVVRSARAACAALVGLLLMPAQPGAAQPTPADTRRSSLLDMSPALQALQRDDTQNPAMLMVQDGAALWQQRAGASAKSCADCHGEAESGRGGMHSLRGVAARYPAIDTASGLALNLGGRIRQCRSRHQQATPWAAEANEVLALSAYLGLHSRGLPIQPPGDTRLQALQRDGQRLWQQRLGQLNLACAHCHDQHAGQRLGGAVIPQAHPTGYPIYRLEWQGLGSLQRRLRACIAGVRAEPFAPDAPEWLALEAYLARRAAGMPVETPAVRP